MRFKDLAAGLIRAITGMPDTPDRELLAAHAEYQEKLAAWNERAEAAKARIRGRPGNANWQPRGEYELSIGLAPVAPGGKFGMHLRAGLCVVDAVAIEVPGERGALVWVPMNAGRHIVDGRQEYARDPRAGIKLQAPRADRPWEGP